MQDSTTTRSPRLPPTATIHPSWSVPRPAFWIRPPGRRVVERPVDTRAPALEGPQHATLLDYTPPCLPPLLTVDPTPHHHCLHPHHPPTTPPHSPARDHVPQRHYLTPLRLQAGLSWIRDVGYGLILHTTLASDKADSAGGLSGAHMQNSSLIHFLPAIFIYLHTQPPPLVPHLCTPSQEAGRLSQEGRRDMLEWFGREPEAWKGREFNANHK